MSVITSTPVVANTDALASDYNSLLTDLQAVESNSPPIGSVICWAGALVDVPDMYLPCDGAAISRATFSDLFALIGETFGEGDNSTTFNVPDLRDRFVAGVGADVDLAEEGGNASLNPRTAFAAGGTYEPTGTVDVRYTHKHNLDSLGQAQVIMSANPSDSGKIRRVSTSASWTSTHSVSGAGDNHISSQNQGAALTGTTNVTTGESSYTKSLAGTAENRSSWFLNSLVDTRPPFVGLIYIIKVE